jgi:glycosyltransferase involved in cell wall biosynthesis
LRRYVSENRIQVLHTFDHATNIFGAPLGRLFGVPVTITSQLWLRSIMPPLRRVLLAAADRIASGIFVNCEAVAQELTSQWKVSSRRIHVCYNGLETVEFNPHNRSRPPQLAGASVVIGTVAALREEKNIPLLVEAFSHVRAVAPQACLLIVGSGAMKAPLEQKVRELNLGDSRKPLQNPQIGCAQLTCLCCLPIPRPFPTRC